jgi:hypothetical protein
VPPDQANNAWKRVQREEATQADVDRMEEYEWHQQHSEAMDLEMEEQEQDEVCNPSLISYNVLRLNDMSVLHVWYDELRRHV